MSKRRHVLVWLAWPAAVVLAAVSVIHFLRYRLGREVDWSWGPGLLAMTALFLLGPPLLLELAARRRGAGGGTGTPGDAMGDGADVGDAPP